MPSAKRLMLSPRSCTTSVGTRMRGPTASGSNCGIRTASRASMRFCIAARVDSRQAEHMGEQARVLARRGRRRKQHDALGRQARGWPHRQRHWPPANGRPPRASSWPSCCRRAATYSMARANCGRLLTEPALRPCAGISSSTGRRPCWRQRLGQGQHLARMAAPAVHQQGHGRMRRDGRRVDGDAGVLEWPMLDAPAGVPVRAPVEPTSAAAACRTGGRRRGPPSRAIAAGRCPVRRGTARMPGLAW